jgi:hypothetical protein
MAELTTVRSRRRWLLVAFAAYLGLALAWAVIASRRADSEHRLCLDVLTPGIQRIVGLGARLEQKIILHVGYAGRTLALFVVLLAAAGLARRGAKGLKPALLLVALAGAGSAQCLLLQSQISQGIRLYIAALLVAAIAETLPARFGSFAGEETARAVDERTTVTPSVAELAVLVLITSAAMAYRFYALNQLPSSFDGEAAYFMASASSLAGVALVNAGVANGPWSPFGWLYYIPVYLVTELFGSHLLSIRFVSAITGVVSIPLLWAFLRRVAGAVEALLGSTLLCFALTDMFWSRTDVFPYHAPGLVAIAIAWSTYEAIVTERLRYFVLTALLMAASYHQFPSGQTLFLIPLVGIGVHALIDLAYLRRCWKKVLVLLVGTVLWYEGQSLNLFLATGHFRQANPFAFNPGKTLWSLSTESTGLLARVGFFAGKVGLNAANVVRSQFVEIVFGPQPHHEAIPTLAGLRIREVSAVDAVLLALGGVLLLLRPKRPASQVLLAWIVAALLPGLLSTSASAHRTAAVFPAFLAVAALGGGDIMRALGVLLGRTGTVVAAAGGAALFAGLGLVATTLYLGNSSASTPLTVVLSETIRPYLTGGTLAILDVENGSYLSSELTYLFLDDLSRGNSPPLWRISLDTNWPEIAFHPAPGFDDWYYMYTRLRDRRPALVAGPPPRRVVFLVQDTPERRSHAELLSQLYPRATPERLKISESFRQYNFVAFVVDPPDLNEVMSPLVRVGAESSLATSPGGWWDGREARTAPARPGEASTVSVGLWVERQRWSRLRCPGAGEGSELLLDGLPLDAGAARPITRGVHRIDIRLGKSPSLPLYLEEVVDRGEFRRSPAASVLGPEVATRAAFAPETVVPYAGYDSPVPVATFDKAFLASLAISPLGEIGSLWAHESRWKIALSPPCGGSVVVWEIQRPEERSERSCIAFAGAHIALLNFPNLWLLDRSGRVLWKKDLRPRISGAHDLAANEAGELFVSASAPAGIHVFSPDGEPETTLLYPQFGPSWEPMKASVPYRGPVAALDYGGKIRVFERASPPQWRVVRSQPGLYSLESKLFQIREDGWLFARVWGWPPEVLVFDESLKRRIARDPAHDLSTFDMGTRFLGFDRSGSLYIYRDGDGRVFRLAQRAE